MPCVTNGGAEGTSQIANIFEDIYYKICDITNFIANIFKEFCDEICDIAKFFEDICDKICDFENIFDEIQIVISQILSQNSLKLFAMKFVILQISSMKFKFVISQILLQISSKIFTICDVASAPP